MARLHPPLSREAILAQERANRVANAKRTLAGLTATERAEVLQPYRTPAPDFGPALVRAL